MATHSSVLAWRIPGTGKPGGLPSVGSHRVRHDWCDLAAAVAVLLLFCVLVFWPQGVWNLSTPTRDWTCNSCTGKRSLNHLIAREVPKLILNLDLKQQWYSENMTWESHVSVLWFLDLSNLISKTKHWLDSLQNLLKNQTSHEWQIRWIIFHGLRNTVPSSIFPLFPVTLKEFKSNFSLEKNEHLILKELETLFEIINYMIWSNKS